MTILFYLQTAFTLWMLVDAMQHGASYYWFMVIFFFQPIGPWVYFFMVKIHDKDMRRLSNIFNRPPSIEQLRYNHKLNPCLENKIKLAQELYRNNQHHEAVELYGEALRLDNEDKEALYGQGLCKTKQGDFQGAVDSFKRVIELERGFRDYAPWQDLAAAMWQDNRKEEAVKTLEELMHTNPRIPYTITLANYLIQLGRKEQSREILRKALEDFDFSPSYVKKQYGKPAREAKELLKTL